MAGMPRSLSVSIPPYYEGKASAVLQKDDGKDFTSIWVFKPSQISPIDFKVYQEFSLTANEGNSDEPFSLVVPEGGYGAVKYP